MNPDRAGSSLGSFRHCWLRGRRHRWSRWVETMTGSYCECLSCGIRDRRGFVETYIR